MEATGMSKSPAPQFSDAPEVLNEPTYPEVDQQQQAENQYRYDKKNHQGFREVPQSTNLGYENEDLTSSPNEQFQEKGQKNRRRICGLDARMFWCGVGILVILIIGGAVGGGVGATVSKSSNTSSASPTISSLSSSQISTTATPVTSSSSSSSTATSITMSASSTASADAAGCPGINGTTYTSLSGDGTTKFLIYCGLDIKATTDLDGTTQTNFDSCLDTCVEWNANTTEVTTCIGATWVISSTVTVRNKQCYLKGKQGVAVGNQGQTLDSAFLVT